MIACSWFPQAHSWMYAERSVVFAYLCEMQIIPLHSSFQIGRGLACKIDHLMSRLSGSTVQRRPFSPGILKLRTLNFRSDGTFSCGFMFGTSEELVHRSAIKLIRSYKSLTHDDPSLCKAWLQHTNDCQFCWLRYTLFHSKSLSSGVGVAPPEEPDEGSVGWRQVHWFNRNTFSRSFLFWVDYPRCTVPGTHQLCNAQRQVGDSGSRLSGMLFCLKSNWSNE